MAKETTPTLCNAIRFMESWMTVWEDHQNLLAGEDHCAHDWVEEGLLWAKKYYRKMDDSKAFAISLCTCSHIFCDNSHAVLKIIRLVLNPYMREKWMDTYWEPSYIDKAKEDILSEVSMKYYPIYSLLDR